MKFDMEVVLDVKYLQLKLVYFKEGNNSIFHKYYKKNMFFS